jgi:hypothetical protein
MVGKAIREAKMERGKPPKVLDHLRVYPPQGEGEGHLIEHHFTSYEHQPERHIFAASEGQQALDHIAEHAKIDAGEPEESMESVSNK